MRWSHKRKGGILGIVVLIIFAGLSLPSMDFEAEAILGGLGNVTSSDNPHNFAFGSGSGGSAAATDPTMTQVCIFCHTPHHAITSEPALLNAPLWNHTLSTIATYTAVKVPDGVNQVSLPANPPDGPSRLCMSCHDGSVAIGAVAYAEGIAPPNPIAVAGTCINVADGKMKWDTACPQISNPSGTPFLDLSIGHHIVSIPVNQALINERLNICQNIDPNLQLVNYPWKLPIANPGSTNVFLRPTAQTYSSLPGVDGSVPISEGETKYKAGYKYGVQCTSCHDPHYWVNTGSYDPNTAGSRFTVDTFNNMCAACHCNPNVFTCVCE